MELKATQVGRHLVRHPYNKATILNAGIEVSGEQHSTIIPFIQLISIKCKRGIIWGELEFELPDDKVVRLHGTEWDLTQLFYQKLKADWTEWGAAMSIICSQLLDEQVNEISLLLSQKKGLNRDSLKQIQSDIQKMFASLPLLKQRLPEFENCVQSYLYCQNWLENGEMQIQQINQLWINQCLEENQDFFDRIEQQPLNLAQRKAVISNNHSSLVLAGAGCGKTAVLVARTGWLLHSNQAEPEQILLLAFSRKASDEMKSRLARQLPNVLVDVKTFHALALEIIQTCNAKKIIKISELEIDVKRRHAFLSNTMQKLCEDKKSFADGWRHWMHDELDWEFDDLPFWLNDKLMERLIVKIDRWLGILRSQSLSQGDIIASAPEENKSTLQKRLRLLAPLLKAWKLELKQRQEIDFSGLITQAVSLLEKGKFKSPWNHILIDEFQDISPLRMALINVLRLQSSSTTSLFAVGDDWQTIYRFSGAELALTTRFENMFNDAEIFILETTYRFNQEIAEITNEFIQQNPYQIEKELQSNIDSKKNSIVILPQKQLENLLDKLSGFVKPNEKVLILARYHYLYPDILQISAKRWPNLNLEFMTIHNSKGQQADYVIILGLQSGKDGFPAEEKESLVERALLPIIDDYPNAEERRLLYVALTRTRNKVWLLEDENNPSVFIKELKKLGVSLKRKV